MTATIAVYQNQQDALSAIKLLKDSGYAAHQLSILGHAQDETLPADAALLEERPFQDLEKPMKIAATGVGIGAIAGPILGVLAGLGLIAIPGVGFLYGAGALAGAVAGLDAGLIGGGIFSALAIAQSSSHHEERYSEALKSGHYIVIAQGSEAEVKQANSLLTRMGLYQDIESYL